MSTIHLDVITAERALLSEDVEMVLAPGTEGQLGILPRHAPLLTGLQAGELSYRKNGQLISMVITGGFMEVVPARVTVLADAAERADDIDIARAEAARQRALARMSRQVGRGGFGPGAGRAAACDGAAEGGAQATGAAGLRQPRNAEVAWNKNGRHVP